MMALSKRFFFATVLLLFTLAGSLLQIRPKASTRHPSRSSNFPRLLAKETEHLEKYEPKTVCEFDDFLENYDVRNSKGEIDHGQLVKSLVVKGDTQTIGSKKHSGQHPVVQLLHKRRQNPGSKDSFKIALSIEGGGMRGCVSAGMVAAIYYLGLEDCVDVVYGSSAGTVIGSYFITRQLQWFGPEIYYDSLTTAGKSFIDPKRLFRALGLGLLKPALVWDVITRRSMGKPVLNLDFLLETTMQQNKPLDWDAFVKMQRKQPLKIVASSLEEQKPVVLDMGKGSFGTLSDMAKCMHASCLLPGIAGPLMNRDKLSQQMVLGNSKGPAFEPMADALFFEPIPFRSAIDEGATHVIVLRTRPDGTDVSGKPSFFEKLIFRRFFLRKNKLRKIYQYLCQYKHKLVYARDVLALNEMSRDMDRSYADVVKPHVMTIAVPPGSPEVTRLETGRQAIFEGVRRGFARAYDALVDDPAERGQGELIAKQFFPSEILKYDPQDMDSQSESAFQAHLRRIGENPESWKVRSQAKSDIAS